MPVAIQEQNMNSVVVSSGPTVVTSLKKLSLTASDDNESSSLSSVSTPNKPSSSPSTLWSNLNSLLTFLFPSIFKPVLSAFLSLFKAIFFPNSKPTVTDKSSKKNNITRGGVVEGTARTSARLRSFPSLFPANNLVLPVDKTAGFGSPVPCSTDSNFNLVQIRNKNGVVVGWEMGEYDNNVWIDTKEAPGAIPSQFPGQSYGMDLFNNNFTTDGGLPDIFNSANNFNTQTNNTNGLVPDVLDFFDPFEQVSQFNNEPSGLVMRHNKLNPSHFAPYTVPRQHGHTSAPKAVSNYPISNRSDSLTSSDSVDAQMKSILSPPELDTRDLYSLSPEDNFIAQDVNSNLAASTSSGLSFLPVYQTSYNSDDGLQAPNFSYALAEAPVSSQIVQSTPVGSSLMVNGVYAPVHSRSNSPNGSPIDQMIDLLGSNDKESIIPEDLWQSVDTSLPVESPESSTSASSASPFIIMGLNEFNNSNSNLSQTSPSELSVISEISPPTSFDGLEGLSFKYEDAHYNSEHYAEDLTEGNSSTGGVQSSIFKCPHCPSTFRVRGYLTRHMKKHAEHKAYSCPFFNPDSRTQCHPSGGFSRRDTYKTHLKARHFKYPPGTRSEHRGKVGGACGGCGQEFASNEQWVEEHIHKRRCPAIFIPILGPDEESHISEDTSAILVEH